MRFDEFTPTELIGKPVKISKPRDYLSGDYVARIIWANKTHFKLTEKGSKYRISSGREVIDTNYAEYAKLITEQEYTQFIEQQKNNRWLAEKRKHLSTLINSLNKEQITAIYKALNIAE